MKLFLIAAIARNRVIGNKGKLPWHIPEDLARFKQLTTSHTVLMGRKTYESLTKPLSNRRNVVLSSKPIKDVETYSSLTLALEALKNEMMVFIIGGSNLFFQTLGMADGLYLTIIDRDVDGDTFFPPYEEELKRDFRLIQESHRNDYSFLDYMRKK
jgi:dihydrofolate reductase